MSSEVGAIEVVFEDDQTGQEIFLYSGQTTTVPSKLFFSCLTVNCLFVTLTEYIHQSTRALIDSVKLSVIWHDVEVKALLDH